MQEGALTSFALYHNLYACIAQTRPTNNN